MSRVIDIIEGIGDWAAAFAEDFNSGVVDAVERIAGIPGRTSRWSLDNLRRVLLAIGRMVGGVLRIAIFYLPAGIVALTGRLADRPTWLLGAGVYAAVITLVGIAGHIRALRRLRSYG